MIYLFKSNFTSINMCYIYYFLNVVRVGASIVVFLHIVGVFFGGKQSFRKFELSKMTKL